MLMSIPYKVLANWFGILNNFNIVSKCEMYNFVRLNRQHVYNNATLSIMMRVYANKDVQNTLMLY